MSGGACFRPARGPERLAHRVAQSRRRLGRHDLCEAELRGLFGAPIMVSDRAQLAGQPDLTERRDGTRASSPPATTPRDAPATASATARSAPGSSTRTPPTTLTNTSALPTPTPACRESTARTSARRLRSMPVDDAPRRHELARRHQRLDLDQQRPRALHRREHDAARRARRLGDEAGARVEHLDEPAVAHLEDADVVRGAEAILQRAQRAIGALLLALELQDAVHEVLEHPRPRERALLRDVPDEQHGGARCAWRPP